MAIPFSNLKNGQATMPYGYGKEVASRGSGKSYAGVGATRREPYSVSSALENITGKDQTGITAAPSITETNPAVAVDTGKVDEFAAAKKKKEEEAAAAEAAKKAAEEKQAGLTSTDKLYEDLMKQADSSWGTTQQNMQANMAALNRKTMAMQGSMGRSVAGGFAGAMSGAFVGGMQQLNNARSAHEQAMNALRERYAGAKLTERGQDIQAKQWEAQRSETKASQEQAMLAQMSAEDKISYLTSKNPAYSTIGQQVLAQYQAAQPGKFNSINDLPPDALEWIISKIMEQELAASGGAQ